uniref:Uncharacterized protein n=1 Tax=Setaria italica TaxID=4555 RepID=K4A3S1_SETIT
MPAGSHHHDIPLRTQIWQVEETNHDVRIFSGVSGHKEKRAL